ncbi:unnamed protein product, partial [Laminaria digitata]
DCENVLENGLEKSPAGCKVSGETLFQQEPDVSSGDGLESGRENSPAAGCKADGETLLLQKPEVSSENSLENGRENSPADGKSFLLQKPAVFSEKGGEAGASAGCSTAVQIPGPLTLGPFWRGPLFHPEFLADTLSEVKLSRGSIARSPPAAAAYPSVITNSSFASPRDEHKQQPCLAGEVTTAAHTPACGGARDRSTAFGGDGWGERRVKSHTRGEDNRET